jgi:hypothetical protein
MEERTSTAPLPAASAHFIGIRSAAYAQSLWQRVAKQFLGSCAVTV